MKIAFIRYENDRENFRVAKALGMDFAEIKEPEEIDDRIDKLKKQKYTTIIIPNDLASFSEKITTKYKLDENLKIIITPSKNKNG